MVIAIAVMENGNFGQQHANLPIRSLMEIAGGNERQANIYLKNITVNIIKTDQDVPNQP